MISSCFALEARLLSKFKKSEFPHIPFKSLKIQAPSASKYEPAPRLFGPAMRTCGHASKYSCQQQKTYGLPSENAKVKPLFRKQLDMIQWNSVEHLHLRWCSPSHRGSITHILNQDPSSAAYRLFARHRVAPEQSNEETIYWAERSRWTGWTGGLNGCKMMLDRYPWLEGTNVKLCSVFNMWRVRVQWSVQTRQRLNEGLEMWPDSGDMISVQ